MRATVAMAAGSMVAVGAHPGYADRENFGRIDVKLSPAELVNLVADQIDLMLSVCRDAGTRMNHVKPHGALYNTACRDMTAADAVVRAIRKTDPGALLFAPGNSAMATAAMLAGVRCVAEVFADRTYQFDGSLTPRNFPNALLTDPRAAAEQVIRAVRSGRVRTAAGTEIHVKAETACVHGDGANAAAILRELRETLSRERIRVAAPVRLT
jgi:UPF0271 protein